MCFSSSYKRDMNYTGTSLSSDKNGNKRWASFEYYSYRQNRRIVYKGVSFKACPTEEVEEGVDQQNQQNVNKGKIINTTSQAYWTKKKGVVKSAKPTEFNINDTKNEKSQWFKKQSTTAADYAHMFGKDYPFIYKNSKITFAKSYLAEIDNMSSWWNDCCYFGIFYKKRMLEDDIVLIEEWIDGVFDNFISKDGTLFDSCPDILEAFVHYSYHKSEGKLIICDLQGAMGANWCYNLTIPTIHSIDQSFGPKDKGIKGIRQVFSNHRCGNLCQKSWIQPQNF